MSSGRLNPVAWTEGMFLRPQHFQQHDVYLEERLRYHLHTLNPHHWGVRQLVVNEDALADHSFEIQQLEAVLPGGTVIKAGVNAVVKPRAFDPASERFSVYVGMRHVGEAEASVTAEQGSGEDARYEIVETELPDLTRAGAIAPVDLAFPNLRIFFGGEEQELELHEWFKLAEVVATGTQPPFVLATDYCPPLLTIQAFPPLSDRVDQIVAQIAAKVRVVVGRTTTLSIGNLPQYWMRYTLQRATPMLRHLLSTGATPPFQLYTALVDVAGALAAFNLPEPPELPIYTHEDLLGCFGSLLDFIDDQLQEVIPDRFKEFDLPYDAESKIYVTEDLNSDTVDPHLQYYLAVKADLDAQDLVNRVVKEAKVGARSTVKLAVRANIAGVPVEHLDGAPTDIQARAGFHYFRLDARHSKWKKIQEDYDFAVALPKVESADVKLYVVEEER